MQGPAAGGLRNTTREGFATTGSRGQITPYDQVCSQVSPLTLLDWYKRQTRLSIYRNVVFQAAHEETVGFAGSRDLPVSGGRWISLGYGGMEAGRYYLA